MTGEIQRAQLFADVDELLAWKKSVETRQAEMIARIATIEKAIEELQDGCKTTLEGCGLLMETDTILSARIDDAWKRIDIVNIRLRKLEKSL